MPVPTVITDLSATASSNSPQGGDNVFPELDDFIRAHAAFIRQNYNDARALDGRVDLIQGRNKIINGKMEIAQRGTSFAPAVDNTYTLDRWRWANASAGIATVSQQADAPSSNEFRTSLRVAVTTADASVAGGDYAFIDQAVEGFNARDLIGRTFSLSFWVRSSKTGVHCVAFSNAGSDRSFVLEYIVNATDTWEYKTVSVAGGLITAGTWNWENGIGLLVRFTLMAGSTFQTTAGAWQTGTFLSTSNQVNVLDTVGNIFAITGVQLEVGSVATPFEHRPYGEELMLCKRYYEVTQRTVATTGFTAGYELMDFRWSVEKRAAPTLSVSVDLGSGAAFIPRSVYGGYQTSPNTVTATASIRGNSEL